jgi:hypothetical protein
MKGNHGVDVGFESQTLVFDDAIEVSSIVTRYFHFLSSKFYQHERQEPTEGLGTTDVKEDPKSEGERQRILAGDTHRDPRQSAATINL